jgi:diguanylate cyclase (GGDEF)-like protein
MTSRHDDRGAPDDTILTALYLAAEQTRLPHEPSHDTDTELERFGRWLDAEVETEGIVGYLRARVHALRAAGWRLIETRPRAVMISVAVLAVGIWVPVLLTVGLLAHGSLATQFLALGTNIAIVGATMLAASKALRVHARPLIEEAPTLHSMKMHAPQGGPLAARAWQIMPLYRHTGPPSSPAKGLRLAAKEVDTKTGLLTAAAWVRLSKIVVTRAEADHVPIAVLMADIDNFKGVNDAYGHQTGDQVLAHISASMTALLRDYDLCGRLGGEEFGILIPNATAAQAQQAAERLRTKLAEIAIVNARRS